MCACLPLPLASSSVSLCYRDTGGRRQQHGQEGRKKELPATPERPRSFELGRPSATSRLHGHCTHTVRPAQTTRTLPQFRARCPSRKGSQAQYTAYIINTDWAEHWTCNHEPAHERRRPRVKGEKSNYTLCINQRSLTPTTRLLHHYACVAAIAGASTDALSLSLCCVLPCACVRAPVNVCVRVPTTLQRRRPLQQARTVEACSTAERSSVRQGRQQQQQ